MASDREEELTRLRNQITRANHAYYNSDEPIMDDASYDRLRVQLERLEADLPHLAEPRAVGAPVPDPASRVQHVRAMLSLDNAFIDSDIAAFRARLRRRAGLGDDDPFPVLCASPKIDGLAVSLRYDNGSLVQGATRGDGTQGEDITASLPRIPDIPKQLAGTGWPSILHIRGEIHMYLDEFAAYNARARANGQRVFVNPRNAASGEVRRIHHSREPLPLHFAAYDWVEDIAKTASDGITHLRAWGLPVIEHWQQISQQQESRAYYADLEARRASLGYDIDGIVIAVDDLALRERLGATAHHPRWAIAWKFPAGSAWTRIENISAQVGRTGSLTPVAHLRPVTIGGVTVSRASLHNQDQINRKDIRIGDWAHIRRAGDVIPQVVEINPDKRSDNSKPYSLPDTCPECDSPAIREDDDARKRCIAGYACPAQKLALLEHFVSRSGFDIEGLGPRQLALFVERGLIVTPADIFALHQTIGSSQFGPLAGWDGFGDTSANALMTAIDTRRRIGLARFLTALGIRHLGTRAASDIAAHVGSLEMLLQALDGPDGEAMLATIDGIGPQTALRVTRYVRSPDSRAIIDDLRARIQVLDAEQTSDHLASPLAGKTVVFTGTLAHMSRATAQAQAKALGARVANTVSKKTDYLIAGESPGTKKDKAQTLKVTVLDEQGWNALTGRNSA